MKIANRPSLSEAKKIMFCISKTTILAASLAILFIGSSLFFGGTASAQFTEAKKVNMYFFWGDGCPHCEDEVKFLVPLMKKYPNLNVYDFETWKNQENLNLMVKVVKALEITSGGVPLTVVGDKYVIGYMSDETTGNALEERVQQCLKGTCPDVTGKIVGISGRTPNQIKLEGEDTEKPTNDVGNGNQLEPTGSGTNAVLKTIKVPLIGEVSIGTLSLPALTVIFGVLDGFNPCAMWTLIFLIGLMLGMENKTRMWILGSAFIVASAGIYFLFMSAWLNAILFLGFVIWIRLGIGVVAIGAGFYNLREFVMNKAGVCKVTASEERRERFEKIKKIIYEKSFWMAFVGIILLAVAVNAVELICSAGFPAIYTQILAMNNLPAWQYYGYIFGYIFFFMIDDLVVFIIAMLTLQITGVTTKYVRISHLVGGILMLIIGVLLMFKPEWLTFA